VSCKWNYMWTIFQIHIHFVHTKMWTAAYLNSYINFNLNSQGWLPLQTWWSLVSGGGDIQINMEPKPLEGEVVFFTFPEVLYLVEIKSGSWKICTQLWLGIKFRICETGAQNIILRWLGPQCSICCSMSASRTVSSHLWQPYIVPLSMLITSAESSKSHLK